MRHVSAQKPTLEKGRAAARPHPAGRPYVVYIAAPVRAYGTPAYRQTVERVRAAAGPDGHVVDAASAWRSTADWRRRWPDLLRALAGAGAWMAGRIIVVPFWGGIIGAGVLAEVDDALRAGVPAAMVRGTGAVSEHARVLRLRAGVPAAVVGGVPAAAGTGVPFVPLGHVHLVGGGEDWSACARLCGCAAGGLSIEEARRLVEGGPEPAVAGATVFRWEDTEDAW